jgi:uncharacterized protein
MPGAARHRFAFGLGALLWAQPAMAVSTHACTPGAQEAALSVCRDDRLAALDRKLAATYDAARAKADAAARRRLTAEQAEWAKRRNDCRKADDTRACIPEAYERRIAALQAFYALVPPKGPFIFVCDNPARDEIRVSFYGTSPPAMLAARGGELSLMFAALAASGAKYEGRTGMFWEHHGQARVRWGPEAPEMTCKPRHDAP